MSSPRTNNYLEGWHNKLKQITRKAHPNVFELVEIFKQEQSEQRNQLSHINTSSLRQLFSSQNSLAFVSVSYCVVGVV